MSWKSGCFGEWKERSCVWDGVQGDLKVKEVPVLSPAPASLPQCLKGRHCIQFSPVVPEVKMYRQVSITFWGAERYPGTGSST